MKEDPTPSTPTPWEIFSWQRREGAEQLRAAELGVTKQNLIFLIHHQSQCCCRNISQIPDLSAIVIVYICWDPVQAGDGTKNRNPANSLGWGLCCGREDADCGQRTVLTHSRCTV